MFFPSIILRLELGSMATVNIREAGNVVFIF